MIDGPTLLAAALAAGVSVEEVFTSGSRSAVDDVVEAAARAGAIVREIGPEVLAKATDTVTPQGVAAVARRVEVTVEEALAAAARGPLALVLVDVADPGNAGTLVRAGAGRRCRCRAVLRRLGGSEQREVRPGVRGGALPRARRGWR